MMHPNKTTSYGTNPNTLQGHLALNSSPLKPSINKLSSQHIIQDHMTSHYYNLATIKSAIDNKPPKSTSLSIKKRDQTRRDALLKQMRTGAPIRTMPAASHKAKKRLSSSYDGNEGRVTSRPLTATSSWSPSHYEPYAQNATARPKTASSFTSRKSFGTEKLSPRSGENATRKDVLNVTYSGDYLDRHQDRFCNSESTPFTPRTKKRSGKSFLSQSKHYAPPTHSHKKKESSTKAASTPRSKSNHKHITEEDVERIDDTDRATDHKRWIEEQSEFVQKLALIEQEEQERALRRDKYAQLIKSRPSSASSFARRQINSEEEEMKYLQFVNEVTNDILTTGVYSDSVLHKLMERHVERRRHDLCVKKMWTVLERLKDDLGMNKNQKSVRGLDEVYRPTKSGPYSRKSEHDEVYTSATRVTYVKDFSEKTTSETDQRRYEDTSSTFGTVTSASFAKSDPLRESTSKKSIDKDSEKYAFEKDNIKSASSKIKGKTTLISHSDSSLSRQTRHKESDEVKSQSAPSLTSKVSTRSLRRQSSGSSSNESVKAFSTTRSESKPVLEEKNEFISDYQTKISSEPNLEEDVPVPNTRKSSFTASEHSILAEKKRKSSSLISFKSSSSKFKDKPSDERFEEQTFHTEGCGLKSQSASSLGSRTSAGSMFRARTSAKDVGKTDSDEKFSSKPFSEEDRAKTQQVLATSQFSGAKSIRDQIEDEIASKQSTPRHSLHEESRHSSLSSVKSTSSRRKLEVDAPAGKSPPGEQPFEKTFKTKSLSSSSTFSKTSVRSLSNEKQLESSDTLSKLVLEKSSDEFFSEEVRPRTSSNHSLQNEKRRGSSDSLRKVAVENVPKSAEEVIETHSSGGSRSPSIRSLLGEKPRGSSDSLRKLALENEFRSVDEMHSDALHSTHSSRKSSVHSLQKSPRIFSLSSSTITIENELKSPDNDHSDDWFSNISQPPSKDSIQTNATAESTTSADAKPRSSVPDLQWPESQTSLTKSSTPIPKKRSGILEKTSFEKLSDIETLSDEHKDSGRDHILSTTSEEDVEKEKSRDKLSNEKLSTETLEERVKGEESTSTKPTSAPKSFLDEIREAALRSSDPAAPPPPDTEDESDYESVAALSMVIRPSDEVKPFEFASDSGSEGKQSTVKSRDEIPTTSAKGVKDTLKPESLNSTMKSDVAYSDDFEDDSDAF